MNDYLRPGTKGKCPHCKVVVRFEFPEDWKVSITQTGHGFGDWSGMRAHVASCPNCEQSIIDLVWWQSETIENEVVTRVLRAYPEYASARADPPSEVPEAIRIEYREAGVVEPVSSRAAAALARRCLQATLHDLGFKADNLFQEIEMAGRDARSSSSLRRSLHIVRTVGNYAAHPTPDGAGDFLRVEPGEIDALFSALDELFDVFYVKPKLQKEREDALNAKLVSAGKGVLPS